MRKIGLWTGGLLLFWGACACQKEEPKTSTPPPSYTFLYGVNDGTVVPGSAYQGDHPLAVQARMQLEAVDSGGTLLRLTLYHTVAGATYPIHAHDYADSTPHGGPYLLDVNGDILDQNPVGTGDSLTVEQYTRYDRAELTQNYQGFLVVHDPLQAVNTADPTTLLIIDRFARSRP